MNNQEQAIGLHALSKQVKNALREQFLLPIWIIAEINQLTRHRSGHMYLELIEKDQQTESIKASVRATIWSSALHRIAAFFQTSTGEDLQEGMSVLLKVQVDYHELYGFSINIRDIDPSYTLGDLARKKAEILKRLADDGVLDMNQELELPRVIQKIAVISSPQAAGYQDFMQELIGSKNEYAFQTKLFGASMQGDQTVSSILSALDRIAEYADIFDAVVLIRGGGSKTDLSYFDDYDLGYYITQFPLPVLTGIGHDKDISIADEVAHTQFKTPTAVAAFIRTGAEEFDAELTWLQEQISHLAQKQLVLETNRLKQVSQNIRLLAGHYLQMEESNLGSLSSEIKNVSQGHIKHQKQLINGWTQTLPQLVHFRTSLASARLTQQATLAQQKAQQQLAVQKHKLELLDKEVDLSDPKHILKKGYSIALSQGKVIKKSTDVISGDRVQLKLANGQINTIAE